MYLIPRNRIHSARFISKIKLPQTTILIMRSFRITISSSISGKAVSATRRSTWKQFGWIDFCRFGHRFCPEKWGFGQGKCQQVRALDTGFVLKSEDLDTGWGVKFSPWKVRALDTDWVSKSEGFYTGWKVWVPTSRESDCWLEATWRRKVGRLAEVFNSMILLALCIHLIFSIGTYIIISL